MIKKFGHLKGVETVKKIGHSVDIVELYKEKFDPVFSGEEPDEKGFGS